MDVLTPERDQVTGWLIFEVGDEVQISTADPRLYTEDRSGSTGKIVEISNPNTYNASYLIELKREICGGFYNGKIRRVGYGDFEFVSRPDKKD